MHIHILGVCGTFMGGLARLACAQGHRVTGSDQQVYPPMSEQLETLGIGLVEGYRAENLQPRPDLVIIGNVLSRGNPEVEAVLDLGLPYTSGAQWLYEAVLAERWVLAVAGTHGKTTTTSMLAFLLEQAGLAPGFLVGGLPRDFDCTARLGDTPFFVVEADEYDTAFFDKRSKFVHYRPRTLVLNNLEYDHADIFPDLAAIQRQVHHLVRMVPASGQIIRPANDPNLDEALAQGCWTPLVRTGLGDEDADFRAELQRPDGSRFAVYLQDRLLGVVDWKLSGSHNVRNALAALAAARHVGVEPRLALAALDRFRGVARRLELLGSVDGVSIYDDFAHHPTAIAATLQGLRARVGAERLVAILEPRSNTMRLGVHSEQLAPALAAADEVLVYQPPGLGWNLHEHVPAGFPLRSFDDLDALLGCLLEQTGGAQHWLFMSNGGFGGIQRRALAALSRKRRR